jgi:hypothetical protein
VADIGSLPGGLVLSRNNLSTPVVAVLPAHIPRPAFTGALGHPNRLALGRKKN